MLAFGAPLGLSIVEALLAGSVPTPGWVASRFEVELAVYVYVTISTTAVFAMFGWIVGRKSDRLDVMSLTDALTGLGNRRLLDRRVHDELARANRYHTPVALLLIDVDGLKDINDQRGHHAGDIALQRVAEVIAASARKTDSAARFGGDEFALLVPNTTAEDAMALAERIRESVNDGGIGSPSVSIGLADQHHAPSLDPEALYRAADRALYVSKAGGRNRVSSLPVPRRVSA